MDGPKWERRKECKRRKGKDGLPILGEEKGMQEEEKERMDYLNRERRKECKRRKRKGWITRSGRVGRNAMGGKEKMDDPKGERRKEFKLRKGKDGWPEVGKEEGMQEDERKG